MIISQCIQVKLFILIHLPVLLGSIFYFKSIVFLDICCFVESFMTISDMLKVATYFD